MWWFSLVMLFLRKIADRISGISCIWKLRKVSCMSAIIRFHSCSCNSRVNDIDAIFRQIVSQYFRIINDVIQYSHWGFVSLVRIGDALECLQTTLRYLRQPRVHIADTILPIIPYWQYYTTEATITDSIYLRSLFAIATLTILFYFIGATILSIISSMLYFVCIFIEPRNIESHYSINFIIYKLHLKYYCDGIFVTARCPRGSCPSMCSADTTGGELLGR